MPTITQENEIDSMEESIHQALIEAVSDRCNCTFTLKFLRVGEFRCWDSTTEVTYRSSVVATPPYASSHIISFIENWVKSKLAVVRRGKIVHQVVSSGCSVGVSSLDAEECVGESKKEAPSLISQISSDREVISCMQSCVARNATTNIGN